MIAIFLKGTIIDFVNSKSGNIAFMLEDKEKNLYYCYTTQKKPFGTKLDEVALIGSILTQKKIKIEYLYNITRNSETSFNEPKNDWIYKLSCSISIILTIIFIISMIYVFYISSYYSFMLSYTISIIIIISIVPNLIIVWAITYLLSNSRRRGKILQNQIKMLKDDLQKLISEESSRNNSNIEAQSGINNCTYCGKEVPLNARFCTICGNELNNE